ncbi:MAG: Helix-turn-helix domain [Verrucomicrobiota bacterium]|jgi:transcriptional regulator with XRE-family HTH domain
MKLPVLTNKNELMPLSAYLGGVYRRLRRDRHLSQRAVSRLSGVARSDISAFERGKQRIYLDTFERICVPLERRPVLVLVETEQLAY